MAKKLMKGCEAIGEAAIQAGCRHFFGYPITPQNEIPEYMSARLPQVGGMFVQAESEVSASNMLYGAAGAGIRCFTSSSSPGISLMQEGFSYIACSEVPCVVVDVMRGGPGLGNIQPSQADYFQMTKGGGHGDYTPIVLAPATVQETVDLVILAFDLADKYCQPVYVIADGLIGQIMEPVELPELKQPTRPDRPWALTGAKGRPRNIITSLQLDPPTLERVNLRLQEVFKRIRENEQRYEEHMTDDADVLIVAYGTAARIARTALSRARQQGIKVGLFRPITVNPYPYAALTKAAAKAKQVLVVEMSAGQMLEDVRLAVMDKRPIHFFGKMGGIVPLPEDVLEEVKKAMA